MRPDVAAEPPPAVLHRQPQLAQDLGIGGDRLLALGRERNPDRGDVNEEHNGARRERTLGLLEAVAVPVDGKGRLGDRAGRLLVLQRHAVGETQQVDQLIGRQRAAVGHPDLDLERVAAVHGRRARDRGVERGRNLFLQAGQDLLLADRREAVRGRAHDLDAVDRLVQPLGFVDRDGVRVGVLPQVGGPADLLRRAGADAREVLLQGHAELPCFRLLQHPDQGAQLDAVGMGLDGARFARQGLGGAGEHLDLGIRRLVPDLGVRIGDRRLADVVVDRAPPLLVRADQLDLDPRSVRRLPLHHLVDDHLRDVIARVDLDLVVVRRLARRRARRDGNRLAGREQAVHAGSRNPNALLAARLPETMELRTI